MDIFDASTEVGDVVEVIVNGDPTSTVDAFVYSIKDEGQGFTVRLGLIEVELDYSIFMEMGMNYHITVGQSDQELQELRNTLKRRTDIKVLVGAKSGSRNDARAKYEAFLDDSIAGIVETTFQGLKTRNSFFKREI